MKCRVLTLAVFACYNNFVSVCVLDWVYSKSGFSLFLVFGVASWKPLRQSVKYY